jgi:ABC-type branched-subunit amino acid transport system ATPase component/ABC-type branched-subunit amino acid transport system permease subunit
MLSALFTAQLLFNGLVRGLIIALIAIAIVLIYRSSRVINFAVASLGVPCAALLAIMAGKHGWPYWPSLAAVLLLGALAGGVVELAVIRRLFRAPRVIVLVATIGVAQLAEVVTLQLPDYKTGRLQTTYPTPFSGRWELGSVSVEASDVMALVAVPAITFFLWWLLGRTRFGVAVAASSTNADLARMTGISPKAISTAIWTLGGFLSAVAVILIATDSGSTDLVSIGPQTLLRGMAAALVGRLVSFPLAVVGALAISVVESVLTFHFTSETGLVQFFLFLVVLVLVARMGRETGVAEQSYQFAPRVRPVPERLRELWWVRNLPRMVGAFGLIVAAVLPLLSDRSEQHMTWATILAFAICATSVIVLTGWAGQLSLGQMAFAGIGALTGAALARGMAVDIGWHSTRVLRGTLPVLSFPWTILIGAAVAAGAATLIGVGALRVRGLLLAISTLAFAIACQAYVWYRPIFTEGKSTIRLPRADLGPWRLTEKNRAYYYFALFVLVAVLLLLSRLRHSGVGRTIIGVRENENAAAAMTVSPARTKLTAFAIAGFVAGLGGGVLGAVPLSFSPTTRYFLVTNSIALVAMAVIGGLGSLSGAVIGALWIVGLPAFWPSNDVVPLLVSSIGLLIMILYIPGGFTQIGYYFRDTFFDWLARRLPGQPVKTATEPPRAITAITRAKPLMLNADGTVLSTTGLTVRFGGLVAVDGVDFHARPGEVVGLIGTNGAGKSTLLNAIGGYERSAGRVDLLGRDVSGARTHERARLGLGRTFQAATLFPELTVRETVELALEARGRTSFWGTLLFLPPATRRERGRHSEARELIDFLGLGRYADRFVAELSTGTRRIVELASVLAVGPRVLCLDEPTAGVAQREAEAFGPLIKRVQAELDATLVIVEHDMPLIMSISDRVYCLEAGQVIAEGSPAEVRTDPFVVASYLGTDQRAIDRSNATSQPVQ